MEALTETKSQCCIYCGSNETRKHGKTTAGRPRRICASCNRSFTVGRSPRGSRWESLRVPERVCRKVVEMVQAGWSLRSVGSELGLDPHTAAKIWRLSGATVVSPKKGVPFYSEEVNLSHSVSDGTIEALALKLAREISQRRAAEYIGPCFEAIVDCRLSGNWDMESLRYAAKKKVNQMVSKTMTWGASLDELKGAFNFEPTID